MTSKERMILEFQHKEPDRVPVSDPCINAAVAEEILGRFCYCGMGGKTVMDKMMLCAEGHRDEFVQKYCEDTYDLHEACDLDFIVCEQLPGKNYRPKIDIIDEKTWVVTDKNTGIWSKYIYNAESDTTHEMDSSMKQEGEPCVERFLDALEEAGDEVDISELQNVKYCKDKAGDKRFIFARPPYVYPAGLSWQPLFMELMYTDPDLAHRICDVMIKRSLNYIKKCGEIGVDGLFVHGDWAYNVGTLFAPDKIREYLMPQIREMSALAHKYGMYFIKHTDGNIMEIADDFCLNMGIDGFQSIEPNAGMSMKVMKERYGDKILLMGNIDAGKTLPYGTPEEVIDESIQCIKDGAVGGGFVLTSCNSISGDIRAKNFMAMIEAAHKYGTYPIDMEAHRS